MKNLNPRQVSIIQQLDLFGFVSVQKLCEFLNVSSVTIRKDLSFLEEEGLLYRTHGGASKQSRYAHEKNVKEKENIKVEEKQQIAREALKLINNNDFIILASGTTLHYLARIINGFDKLTLLTSSLRVSLELSKNPLLDIIQLGGEVRKSSSSIVGHIAEKILNSFSCNKLFLGVDGIDFDFGISTSNSMEARLNQLMMERAEKVIILADSSKLNKKGFGKISDLTGIDVLITDNKIAQEDKEKLEELGIQVIVAE